MTNDDRIIVGALTGRSQDPGSAWPDVGATVLEGDPPGFAAEPLSLHSIMAAIRRGVRLWCVLAVVGMLACVGYKLASPAPYRASTTLLLPQDAQSQDGQSQDAISTDVALAHSRAVAGLVVQRLRLSQSTEKFADTYTVADPTDEVLAFTVSAPSGAEAVRRADALGAAFLQFRTGLIAAEQRIGLAVLQQQVSQASQQVQALSLQVSQLNAQLPSPANQAKLSRLQTDLSVASSDLTSASNSLQVSQQQAALQERTSKVLDKAALLPRSVAKTLILAAAVGLVVGLLLGLAIVLVRAVVFDRVRRREDVADALGVPLALSVGQVWPSRWPRRRPDPNAEQTPAVRRLVRHLREVIPPAFDAGAALAIVAVDDLAVAALSVVRLAVTCAADGRNVVVADLAPGAPAARLLGPAEPGLHPAVVPSGNLSVAVPDPEDVTPLGPRLRVAERVGLPSSAKDLADASRSADLVLALTKLDPALGADHLATWADSAVVVVTAGRSSWARIHATAEMLRLGHVRLASAVLIGADAADESLGVVPEPAVRRR